MIVNCMLPTTAPNTGAGLPRVAPSENRPD
jgi:hypothetical protein